MFEKFMNDAKEIIGVEGDEVGDQRRRFSSGRILQAGETREN